MYIQQLYTNCLAQAAYYIESGGEAAIIDPMRDIDEYIELLHERGAKLKYIFETHFHADFVSGHIDLAKKTGATIIFGPNAKPTYEATIVDDSDIFHVGHCLIKVLHTPGHTIESICCLLYNESEEPYALFSGDTLFVGDVGRPDLLSGNLSAAELAAQLYHSLEKIKVLPDEVILYPGHGPGSACGKNLGKELYSTLGIQKQLNYALQPMRKEEFVDAVTKDQPVPPAYFFKDAAINKFGYKSFQEVAAKTDKELALTEVFALYKKGALFLDVRSDIQYIETHMQGSIHIGLNGSYAIWAGTFIDIEQKLVILCEKGKSKEAITRLGRIGYENIAGYYDEPLESMQQIGIQLTATNNITPQDLSDILSSVNYTIIDVRRPDEYAVNFLPNSVNIPLNIFHKQVDSFNRESSYLLYCAGGYRSLIAASIMEHNGFVSVANIDGGASAMKKIGLMESSEPMVS